MKNYKMKAVIIFSSILFISLWFLSNQFEVSIRINKQFIDNKFPILSDSNPIKYNWNITWGRAGNDELYAISTDSTGNIYGTGYVKNDGVDWDMKLVKFDSSGAQLWNRTYDGPYGTDQFGTDLVIDSTDNVFVGGDVEPVNALNSYIALFKYNSSGDFQWSNINFGTGGNTFNRGFGIALDSMGNIYITGRTSSYGEGGDDICLVKYNSSGVIQWYRTWGGINDDCAYTITLDSSENIYLAGYTESFGAGDIDIVLVKYDSSGVFQWYRIWGGAGADYANSIALDSSENIYLTGSSNTDLCLVKYNSAGTYLWNKTSGFGGNDDGQDIIIDSLDYIYLGGSVSSNGFDMYLSKYDEDGNRLWDYMWGGSDFEMCLALTLISQSNIYLAGITDSYGAGDEDFSLVSLTILPLPIITIISPDMNDVFGKDAPTFEILIDELNLVSTWYTIDGGLTNITFSGVIGTIDENAWENALEGEITITFYAQNTGGYVGNKNVVITKNIPTKTPTIPGYDIFFLLSFLSLVAIIIKRKKRSF